MFSFGPLSGLADIANGQPGTEFPSVFNMPLLGRWCPAIPPRPTGWQPTLGRVSPISTAGFTYNGAVGLAPDIPNLVTIYDISEVGHTVTVVGNAPLGVAVGDQVTISGTGHHRL